MNLVTDMATEDQSEKPAAAFDEQAAIENLAHLQRELEASRQRRKDASAAFDAFVSSFRKGPAERGAAAVPRSEHRSLASAGYEPTASTPSRGKRHTSTRRIGLIAGGVIAVAAGVLIVRTWRGSPADESERARTPPPVAVAQGATPSAASKASTEAATVSSTRAAELIAVRDVWVRAIVDGQRVLERELEAGTRVPLRGRTIIIRAGNAGAVRMIVDGQDRGTLGGEGVVLTRTYTSTTSQ